MKMLPFKASNNRVHVVVNDIEDKEAIKTKTGGKVVDHMESLLLQSKQF